MEITMITVALDPGIRGCGLAVFRDATLIHASYVKNTAEGHGPEACYHMGHAVLSATCNATFDGAVRDLVLEWPQVYTDKRQWKGDPNDLMPLAGVDVAVTCWMRPEKITHYLPREWKGQAPKEVIAARAMSRLSDEEKSYIAKTRKDLLHNVHDAIALGLFHLGRLNAERVIAR
jgi:hypothetical protein